MGGGSTGLPEDVAARRRVGPDADKTRDDNHQDNDNDNKKKEYTIVAMYKFQRIDESRLESLKSELVALLQRHEAFGNLLLAVEGINGTVCYPTKTTTSGCEGAADDCHSDDPVRQYLRSKFTNAMMRVSYASHNVFFRLRIRIKNEVVTMGVPDVNLVESGDGNGEGNMDGHDNDNADDASPEAEWGGQTRGIDRPGTYVSPSQWNELLQDPATLVIDTRNEYEINVGTFQNAMNPHTTSFVEFPLWLEQQLLPSAKEGEALHEHPSEGDVNGSASTELSDESSPAPPQSQTSEITKLAFFCTGGVRCEKATAYAQRLFKEQQRQRQSSSAAIVPEVYHLKGGILGYLESVPPEESMFKGECYVFDNRVAVTHGLQPTTQYQACRACRHPLSPEDIASDTGLFLEGRQCRYCADDPDKEARRSRYEMRHQQVAAAQQKGQMHLGSHSLDALRAKQKVQQKAAAKAAATAMRGDIETPNES
jgi:UPF0176 protein